MNVSQLVYGFYQENPWNLSHLVARWLQQHSSLNELVALLLVAKTGEKVATYVTTYPYCSTDASKIFLPLFFQGLFGKRRFFFSLWIFFGGPKIREK